MNSLTTICESKLQHIAKQKRNYPLHIIERKIQYEASMPRGFAKTLREKQNNGEFAIIAELKKASPSRGLIRPDFAVEKLARDYADGGASCLSVLTDIPYFQGNDEYLQIARENTNLPVLRKDFILDTYQIFESRSLGADAILLIMACLENSQAAELEAAAIELGMDVLVEVHDFKELERALKNLRGGLIGVNNRNLKTLVIDLDTSRQLAKEIPANYHKVCESGISTNTDLKEMQNFGYNSFLVGESLMRQDDIKKAVSDLLSPAAIA